MNARVIRRLAIALAIAVVLGLFVTRIPRTITVFLIAAFIAFRGVAARRPLTVARAAPGGDRSGLPRTARRTRGHRAHRHTGDLRANRLAAVACTGIRCGIARFGRARGSRIAASARHHIVLPSVAEIQGEVGSRVADVLNRLFDYAGPFVIGTLDALFIGVSALILSVFFVSRGPLFGHSLLEFVPPRKRDEASALFNEIASIFGHFVAGQVFLCAMVAAAVWLTLLPLHFTFALLVAVICGLVLCGSVRRNDRRAYSRGGARCAARRADDRLGIARDLRNCPYRGQPAGAQSHVGFGRRVADRRDVCRVRRRRVIRHTGSVVRDPGGGAREGAF